MNIFNQNLILNFDAPSPWGLYFQDSAPSQMEGIIELHNSIMCYLVLILFAGSWILFSILYNFISRKTAFSHKYLIYDRLIYIFLILLMLILIYYFGLNPLYTLYVFDNPALQGFDNSVIDIGYDNNFYMDDNSPTRPGSWFPPLNFNSLITSFNDWTSQSGIHELNRKLMGQNAICLANKEYSDVYSTSYPENLQLNQNDRNILNWCVRNHNFNTGSNYYRTDCVLRSGNGDIVNPGVTYGSRGRHLVNPE